MTISAFTGEYRWLSNFWPAEVQLDGITYPTVEHAYQAAKTLSLSEQEVVRRLPTPAQAKKLGRTIGLRPDWDQVKDQVMAELVWQKFQHSELKAKLLATGDQILIEGNTWHDNYWGSCTCTRCGNKGRNALGDTLMLLRTMLREKLVITVVNTHHTKEGEYIGRGSPLGNPFSHMDGTTAKYTVGTREEAVQTYEIWLEEHLKLGTPQIIAELNRLGNLALDQGELKLRCYCAPKACHGDVIKEFLLAAIRKELNL